MPDTPELELPELLPLLPSAGETARGEFSARQVRQLLQPIHPRRVVGDDGKGNAHVAQQDITAHLIRVFGFGHFDTEVVELSLLFEHNRADNAGKPSRRWDVGYRATVRLTVRDEHGYEVCHYEDGSTGVGENLKLGDAHDLAMKSALSLAKKRCAVNLGDQFGLSLYNKGQRTALVIATLVEPTDDDTANGADVQGGVPQQEVDGHREDAPPTREQQPDRRVSASEITGGAQ